LNNETVGQGFDYSFLPATGVAGGAVVAWRRDLWDASDIGVRRFSVTIRLKPLHSMGEPWWLTTVYGPANREDKPEFLMELRAVASACQGPWLVVGDFNLIYKASDKNNGRLHHGKLHSWMVDHLFAACVLTRELWHRLLQRVGFQFLCPNGDADLVNWWLASRREISSGFRKGFDSLVLLVSWETWKERNRRTFGGAPSSVAHVMQGIQHEGAEWVSAGFRSLAPLFAP